MEDDRADEKRLKRVQAAVQRYGETQRPVWLEGGNGDGSPPSSEKTKKTRRIGKFAGPTFQYTAGDEDDFTDDENEDDDDDQHFDDATRQPRDEKEFHNLPPLSLKEQGAIYEKILSRYRVFYGAKEACHLGLSRQYQYPGGEAGKSTEEERSASTSQDGDEATAATAAENNSKSEEQQSKKKEEEDEEEEEDKKKKQQRKDHFLSTITITSSSSSGGSVLPPSPPKTKTMKQTAGENGDEQEAVVVELRPPEVLCNEALELVLGMKKKHHGGDQNLPVGVDATNNAMEMMMMTSTTTISPSVRLLKALHVLKQLDFRNLLEAEIVKENNRCVLTHLQSELHRTSTSEFVSAAAAMFPFGREKGVNISDGKDSREKEGAKTNSQQKLPAPPPPSQPPKPLESSGLQLLFNNIEDTLDDDAELKAVLLNSLALWQVSNGTSSSISGALYSLHEARKVAKIGLLPKLELVALYNLVMLNERSGNYSESISLAAGPAMKLVVSLADKATVVEFFASQLRCFALQRDVVGVVEIVEKIRRLAWPPNGSASDGSSPSSSSSSSSSSSVSLHPRIETLEMEGDRGRCGIGHIFGMQQRRRDDGDDDDNHHSRSSTNPPVSFFEDLFSRGSLGSVSTGNAHPLPKALTALTVYGRFRVFAAPILSCGASSLSSFSSSSRNVFSPVWKLFEQLEKEGGGKLINRALDFHYASNPPPSPSPSQAAAKQEGDVPEAKKKKRTPPEQLVDVILHWIAVEATLTDAERRAGGGVGGAANDDELSEGGHRHGGSVGYVRYLPPLIGWVLWMQLTPDRNVLIPGNSR